MLNLLTSTKSKTAADKFSSSFTVMYTTADCNSDDETFFKNLASTCMIIVKNSKYSQFVSLCI